MKIETEKNTFTISHAVADNLKINEPN